MKLKISPSRACGTVSAPPSKSMAHRALIAASLSAGESRLSPLAPSQDILATMDVMHGLGADFLQERDTVTVHGVSFPVPRGEVLRCRESGSTLRFAIPLCLLTGEKIVLEGSPRLMERPLSVYEELCASRGFLFQREGNRLIVKGKLEAGDYTVPGNISSQFITGLLFALSLLPGESRLRVTGRWESASYLDMTLSAMKDFGVSVAREGKDFLLQPGSYRPRIYTVEGDWSNAAFLEGFSVLGGEVSVEGLREDSLQGDRVYRRHFQGISQGFYRADLSDCPDLGPVLMVMAALFHGAAFTGTARLKIKESDRGAAMAEELKKCGVLVRLEENAVRVFPDGLHSPAETLCGHNDHRIVMALSLLLSRLGGELVGAEAVTKSYPNFFEEIRKLGIKVKEL